AAAGFGDADPEPGAQELGGVPATVIGRGPGHIEGPGHIGPSAAWTSPAIPSSAAAATAAAFTSATASASPKL
ncbi:MAG TPA: hypothetical protein VIM08_07160, partial [Arthrobacter sp.]